MARRSSYVPFPGTAPLLRRAILCLLAVGLAVYLWGWFWFALDTARMEAVAEWGRRHGIVWDVRVQPGGAYVAPGRVVHPNDFTDW
jgi:hypothetical protein